VFKKPESLHINLLESNTNRDACKTPYLWGLRAETKTPLSKNKPLKK
jgi:hypothetical protein